MIQKFKDKAVIVSAIDIFVYGLAVVMGYVSLITGNGALWAWAVGVTAVAVLLHIGLIAAFVWIDHKEKKGGKAE